MIYKCIIASGQGETAKLQQEARPERPGWMKDAELKRKRASNIITGKSKIKKIIKSKNIKVKNYV